MKRTSMMDLQRERAATEDEPVGSRRSSGETGKHRSVIRRVRELAEQAGWMPQTCPASGSSESGTTTSSRPSALLGSMRAMIIGYFAGYLPIETVLRSPIDGRLSFDLYRYSR